MEIIFPFLAYQDVQNDTSIGRYSLIISSRLIPNMAMLQKKNIASIFSPNIFMVSITHRSSIHHNYYPQITSFYVMTIMPTSRMTSKIPKEPQNNLHYCSPK